MASRRHLVFVLVGVVASLGASYRTNNFVVDAPTSQLAQQFAQMAEHYRREKAIQWLGYEMPPWPEPCPVKVRVTNSSAGGATSFAFDGGRVLGQQMEIKGSLNRLLVSVLPHEVTHTVFAYYFRCPLPRWADEGGAVLSEDEIERDVHDRMCRQILNTPGRAIPLRQLFTLRQYPGDVMTLYAEGFSVAQYLVNLGGRHKFLSFVAHGMSSEGWDSAARSHYHFNSVEELEQAWLAQLRRTRRLPAQLAANTPLAVAQPGNSVLVRQTLPPAQPFDSPPGPIFRGQAPSPEQDSGAYAGSGRLTAGRPGYLPEYNPGQPRPPAATRDNPPFSPSPAGWQPANPQPYYQPPAVKLGPPQSVPLPVPALGQPVPSPGTRIGYPN